jgi:phospholipid transport system substrate-binding protein
MKKFIIILVSLIGFSFCVNSMAQAPDPMVMLKSVSDQMIGSLKKNRSRLKRNPKLIFKLVDRILLPYVDQAGMSRSVVGRRTWTRASKAQQRQFVRLFTNVVIDTYASALNAYTDESIRFYPIRGGYQGKKRIEVHSKVIRDDGPAVSVNYRLALKRNKWFIYDLNVEGVSLLQSFRAQFSAQISQGKTLADLNKILRNRNRKKGH